MADKVNNGAQVISGSAPNTAAFGDGASAGTSGKVADASHHHGMPQGVLGAGAGYKIARGQATTVTASDTVVTGLATVVAVVASLDDAPTTDPEIATASIGDQAGAPAAGSILIKTWKTFGGTPVAATTFSKKVNWIAFGT